MCALVHQLSRQYTALPPSTKCRPSCSWTGLLDQFFRDGERVKRPADKHGWLQGPGATGISKEHTNGYLIQ